MATITNSIKQRFIKDYNLPINIFEDDVFNYFIDLYDKTHKTKQFLLIIIYNMRGILLKLALQSR
jgi:hypothetical protein